MSETTELWRQAWGQSTDGTDYESWLERRAVAMQDALLAWRRAWGEQGERKCHLMVAAAALTEQALALLPADGKRSPLDEIPCHATSPPAGPP